MKQGKYNPRNIRESVQRPRDDEGSAQEISRPRGKLSDTELGVCSLFGSL